MRRVLAAVAIAVTCVLGLGSATAAPAQPTANASCTNAATPGGTRCLAPGEYCSHKSGYAAAYKRAGYRCNRKGRLEYR